MSRVIIVRDATLKARAHEALDEQEMPYRVRIDDRVDRRTSDSNALMWVLLGKLSEFVEWHGQKLSADDWKTMCSAALKGQRAIPSINPGQFVVMGQKTSRMTKAEFSDLIEFIYAFGAERGVNFNEQK